MTTMNSPHTPSTLHELVPMIDERDVVIATGSMEVLDTVTNIYHGTYLSQTARFIEMRQLPCHTRASIDVRSVCVDAHRHSQLIDRAVAHQMLRDGTAIRMQNQTPDHVLVVGLVAASGGRLLLVEAPYQYTALNEYLAAHPNADRRACM